MGRASKEIGGRETERALGYGTATWGRAIQEATAPGGKILELGIGTREMNKRWDLPFRKPKDQVSVRPQKTYNTVDES